MGPSSTTAVGAQRRKPAETDSTASESTKSLPAVVSSATHPPLSCFCPIRLAVPNVTVILFSESVPVKSVIALIVRPWVMVPLLWESVPEPASSENVVLALEYPSFSARAKPLPSSVSTTLPASTLAGRYAPLAPMAESATVEPECPNRWMLSGVAVARLVTESVPVHVAFVNAPSGAKSPPTAIVPCPDGVPKQATFLKFHVLPHATFTSLLPSMRRDPLCEPYMS